MLKLLADAQIPHIQRYFAKNFTIEYYHNVQELQDRLPNQDVLISRSTTKIDASLLHNHNLKVIATASSGVDHIDHQHLLKNKIQFFSGHGANAGAVCDYVLSVIAYLLTHSLLPKTLKIGIIGYGAIGKMLKQRLETLKFFIGIYDPYIPHRPNPVSWSQLSAFNLLCLHPNYHHQLPYPSHMLITSNTLHQLHPEVCIINTARGNIVDESSILDSSFQGIYCTDVYSNEPQINPNIIARSVICTPHIAGHTIEAKQQITAMIAAKVHQFFTLPYANTDIQTTTLQLDPDNWPEQVLSWYNPEIETKILKEKPNAETFIKLRQLHHFRHDFNAKHI